MDLRSTQRAGTTECVPIKARQKVVYFLQRRHCTAFTKNCGKFKSATEAAVLFVCTCKLQLNLVHCKHALRLHYVSHSPAVARVWEALT